MNGLVTPERGGLIPVVSYARTSEDFRQRDGHGVRHQVRINERTAQQQGCRVVAVYADNGCSATRAGAKRPGFERLIEDLVRGRTADGQEIRGVVCVADDRLYRRPEDLSRFYAALTAREGRVYIDPQGIRDPYAPDGLLQAVRSLEVAVAETQVRSRRVSNWHWARAVEGVPHSGPRPFGWQDDRISLHPNEAVLVERAIGERIGGTAVRAIARAWCDLGVTGTRGGRPNAQTVTQIMTAPRVCGYRANRGVLLSDPGTGEPVCGQWQPIVSPEEWKAVCATFSAGSLYLHRGTGAPRLTENGKGTPRARTLGSGFLRCGAVRSDGSQCGGAMCTQNGRSKRSPYVYTCRSCARCSISGPLADEALERILSSDSSWQMSPPGPAAAPGAAGEWGLEAKREVIGSLLSHCVVRPGEKGNSSWDHSRVQPVWRCAVREGGAAAVG
ncbi:recombinase family protein [Streptomyces sp. NPDC051014]|uniref:recombinase family protein n=1 Tax=Streptomyces sp. NPDC051014 TaxID=3155751 RepID=UPI0033D8D5AE